MFGLLFAFGPEKRVWPCQQPKQSNQERLRVPLREGSDDVDSYDKFYNTLFGVIRRKGRICKYYNVDL